MNLHFNAIMISFIFTMLIAMFFVVTSYESFSFENSNHKLESSHIMTETKYYNDYETLKADPNTVVIYPIFTQSAYDWDGIHDFYTGRCDTCTTVPIHNYYEKIFAASGNGFTVLEFLGYDIIDDITLDKNPEILEKYDKVILLHNEFVTQSEFDSISKHKKVIYLYPNSLNSKIETDYTKNIITLIQGPGFPNESNTSGFDWKYDNSKYMKNWDCKDWEFEKIPNGYMLNCFPERILVDDGYELLSTIKTL